LLYKMTKIREKQLLNGSDAFVVLTGKARGIIGERVPPTKPIAVIPCCVDTERFAVGYRREGERAALGVRDEKLLVYVGALDGWYLTREMAEFFAEVRAIDQRWKLFVATQSDAKHLVDVLKQRKVSDSSYRIQYLPNSEIPNLLSAADAAYCFIKPSYSKRASSPTKIGEYLSAGLPVLCNSGIGDVDDLLERNRVGTTLADFSPDSYRAAFSRLTELGRQADIANRCRAVAKSELDLKSAGGPAYQSIYLRALGREAKVMYA
jgi:glycosyltransferase involved in cell wall biosynthesis